VHSYTRIVNNLRIRCNSEVIACPWSTLSATWFGLLMVVIKERGLRTRNVRTATCDRACLTSPANLHHGPHSTRPFSQRWRVETTPSDNTRVFFLSTESFSSRFRYITSDYSRERIERHSRISATTTSEELAVATTGGWCHFGVYGMGHFPCFYVFEVVAFPCIVSHHIYSSTNFYILICTLESVDRL
jgi:hypothetical protein